MNTVELKVVNPLLKKFDKDGVPAYATQGSAAFDLRAMFNQEGSQKYSVDEFGTLVIQPNQSVLIPTGIAINIGEAKIDNVGIAAIVLPRSSVGAKRGLLARLYEFDVTDPLGLLNSDGEDDPIDVGNICGLIDSDYQGEVFVSVWNRSDDAQTIEFGERIAQLMFTPVIKPTIDKVDDFTPRVAVVAKPVEDFSVTTDRGEGGLGSTGKK